MSMRSWTSRLLVWLAAFSALASFALAEPLGSRLGSVAIICGAAALLVWRGWKPPPGEALPAPTSVLDDDALLEATARIARACSAPARLDDALCGVAQTLAQELGARNVRASRVDAEHGQPRLAPLIDLARPDARRPASKPSEAVLRVLRDGGVVSDAAHGHALAVQGSSGMVALIDFDGLELDVEPAALGRLLDLAHADLGEVARRDRRSVAAPSLPETGSDAPDFLASITANAQVGLFVLEPRHLRLVAISRRAERDFAARRQRLLGKTVSEAFGASIAQNLEPAVAEALGCSTTVEQVVYWPSPRGQRGANLSLCVLRHDDGSPRWLVAMARDLTLDAVSGGERRAMPRHGLLHVDVKPQPAAHLPRPVVAANRRNDTK
jgi:PAS fold